MIDKDKTCQETLPQGLAAILRSTPAVNQPMPETNDVFCYLDARGQQGSAVEFRFRDGYRIWFSYHLLATGRFNPSQGLLLRFSGDLIYPVLIQGSNLDRPLNEDGTTLLQGLQDRRVRWVREMSPQEIEMVGESGPVIDGIAVAECESNAELKDWLNNNAPHFSVPARGTNSSTTFIMETEGWIDFRRA